MADLNATTGVLMTNPAEMVEQSIRDRLRTGLGTRFWNPEYGSTLELSLDTAVPDHAIILAEVYKALAAEGNRLLVSNVTIARVDDITIRVTVDGIAYDRPISATVEV